MLKKLCRKTFECVINFYPEAPPVGMALGYDVTELKVML